MLPAPALPWTPPSLLPAAFPFFYIEPAKAENLHITQKFAGKITKAQAEDIAPIGNSPTFMAFKDMKVVMPHWMNQSIAIFKDTEANQVRGRDECNQPGVRQG